MQKNLIKKIVQGDSIKINANILKNIQSSNKDVRLITLKILHNLIGDKENLKLLLKIVLERVEGETGNYLVLSHQIM
uniref:Uncharacterized protein n=1 Tax=Meloidogyne enterolobii TaxID=390850 RepID=A0A6V7VGM6_MELEN|nr:unnamed protein product [Meloidogyne enterolobii]